MKLINTTHYLLLIDEEAEIKGTPCLCYNSIKNTWNDDVILYQGSMPEYHYKGFQKIIAYYLLTKEAKELDLPMLPNPFKDVADVEKLACAKYNVKDGIRDYDERYYNTINVAKAEAFIEGYNAAPQSKQYSLEDMIAFGKKCFYKGFDKSENDDANSFTAWREECSKLIQSLSNQQLPKEFIPEYDLTQAYYKFLNGLKIDIIFSLVDEDFKDIICKGGEVKRNVSTLDIVYPIKTVTNSEGKEELSGTYKY